MLGLEQKLTCNEEDIVGTAPLLIASRKDCVIPARTGPVIIVAPTCLGLVLSKTNFVNASRPDLNSGRNSSNCARRHAWMLKELDCINSQNECMYNEK